MSDSSTSNRGSGSMYDELLRYYQNNSKGKDIDCIVDFLEQKYNRHEYFTQLGRDCLLFMNPASPKEDPAFAKERLDDPMAYLNASPLKYAQETNPHLFQKAAITYANMLLTGKDQTLLFL